MAQTGMSLDTYKGLQPKVKIRAGALFMNQIVSVFAKYNYEVVFET